MKQGETNLLQAREFEQNLDVAFDFIKQHFVAILIPMSILFLVLVGTFFLRPTPAELAMTIQHAVANVTSAGGSSLDVTMASYGAMFSAYGIVGLIGSLISMLVISLITSYTVCYMYESLKSNGEEVDRSLVIGKTLKVALPIFLGQILFSIILSIGLVLCVVPGIFILVSFLFFIYVYVNEETSLIDSFKRSFELVKDNWWITFGYLVVTGLIVFLIALIFSIPSFLGVFFPSNLYYYISSIIALLGSVTIYIISAIAVGVYYYNLRARKENLNIISQIDNIGGAQ